MVMLLLLGMVLVAAALLLVTLATASRSDSQSGVVKSLAVLEAMSTAPAELTAELDRPFADRVLEPLQARALHLGRRLSGAETANTLRRKLELAGNPAGWTVDRVLALKVIGAVVGGLLGLLVFLATGWAPTTKIVVVLGLVVAGYFAPNLYLYQTSYDRQERIQKELADAVDLLTISVESGLAFDSALQQVSVNTEGPLAEEFARVLREMQIGQGRSVALRALADRTNQPDLRSLVSALVQADAFGIPIAQVLRIQSSEMRTKRRQRAEEKAQQVPVKITVPLIFCILPCLFIAVMGPAALSVMENIGG